MRLFIRERRALARIVPAPGAAAAVRRADHDEPEAAARWSCAWRSRSTTPSRAIATRASPTRHCTCRGSRIVSRDEALRLNPLVAPDGVTGGAVWYDYQMVSTDRVTLSFLLSAADAGATAANYVKATASSQQDGRVIGVRVEDGSPGSTFDVRGTVVVNAAGPWAAGAAGRRCRRRRAGRAAASPVAGHERRHPQASVDVHACGGVADGRFLFLVPWRDVSMLGTSHDVHDGAPTQLKVTRWDLEALPEGRARGFPARRPDAARRAAGPPGPAADGLGRGRTTFACSRKARSWTTLRTARRASSRCSACATPPRGTRPKQAVDAVFRSLGHATPPPCRTAETPLLGGSMHHVDSFLKAVAAARTSTACPTETLRAHRHDLRHRLRPGAADGPRRAGAGAPARPRPATCSAPKSSMPRGRKWR